MTNKHPLCLGLLAHVDAGKTSLSEAMLYTAGARRQLGRVDHKDAFLDTHGLERQRGITIFSKQALFSTAQLDITLLDTPGHVDFSTEAERVIPVLDCAVLVISGTDGIQAHTLTLWQMLARYKIPVFLFINKQDLPGQDLQVLLAQLKKHLDPGCAFLEDLPELAAMEQEDLLEEFLTSGKIPDESIQHLIRSRKLFPCLYGSALKLDGVDTLLDALDRFAPRKEYPDAFAAQVYKISYDPQGSRLTWLKVTGGTLSPKTLLGGEKVQQLRRYSADKFTLSDIVCPGQICAATGLSETYAGQCLGAVQESPLPMSQSIMTYRLVLPKECDPTVVLPKLRQLEEEDPALQILYTSQTKDIHVQIMGKVQLEILQQIIAERFHLEVSFAEGRILYKETIANPVDGVGHFEPLRHYAEVHLLLEPLSTGEGLQFASSCPTDALEQNFQHLVLTHLQEKTHLGVLTGSPITDMKITLLAGKAHVKHTEGGDFRQATYRAVRQGLMEAESILLEPRYAFTLRVPSGHIGRAITDLRQMDATIDPPETQDDFSILTGAIPAANIGDYPAQLAAYTKGLGLLQLTFLDYAPCHNTKEVIGTYNYDPEADLENTPDSVFCDHGAGVTIKWNQVKNVMHVDSGWQVKPPVAPTLITQNLHLDEKELEKIMLREFGPIKRPQYKPQENVPLEEKVAIRPPRQTTLIVDGYNIIFAWEELASIAKEYLDAARRRLCDLLSSYAGFRKMRLIVVFDGYKRKGNPGEKTQWNNIQVVYTRENETADSYIESLVAQIGKNDYVKVATSDALVQLSAFRSGVLRMPARELMEEVTAAQEEMRKLFQ